MKRDVKKQIELAKELEHSYKVAIYLEEMRTIQQIAQIKTCEEHDGKLPAGDYVFNLIDNAILFGVAVGYNAGKREEAKKHKKSKAVKK